MTSAAPSIEAATQLFLDGKFAEALAAFDQVLLTCPSDQKPVVHANRGAALMSLGSVEESVKSFDDALAIDPNHLESLHNKGVALSELEKFDEAAKCFQRVTELSPTFFAAHAGLSEALCNLGRYEDAIAAAQKAIDVDPSTPVGHTDKAFALLKMKRFKEANDAYAVAVSLGDSSAETTRLYSISLSQHALDLEAEGKPKEALALLTKSLELNPAASGFHNRGIILLQLNNLKEAMASLRRAIEINPEYFESLAALGALSAQENDLKTAEELLRRALALDPRSTEARFNLGVTRIKAGDVAAAKAEWTTVLEHEPGEPNATAALAILNEWTTKEKSGAQQDKQVVIDRIAGLNAPPSTPESKPAQPTKSKPGGIVDPVALLHSLDEADAALRSASVSEPFPGEGQSASPASPARRKSVFHAQPESDVRRSYVRDISSGPVQEKAPAAAPLPKVSVKNPPPPSLNADASLLSALAKLDEELASKGVPRRGSVVNQVPVKQAVTYADPVAKKYSVAELKRNPPGVDPTCKQLYLSDQDFLVIFGKTPKEFSELPLWKQVREKKRTGLF